MQECGSATMYACDGVWGHLRLKPLHLLLIGAHQHDGWTQPVLVRVQNTELHRSKVKQLRAVSTAACRYAERQRQQSSPHASKAHQASQLAAVVRSRSQATASLTLPAVACCA